MGQSSEGTGRARKPDRRGKWSSGGARSGPRSELADQVVPEVLGELAAAELGELSAELGELVAELGRARPARPD